MNQGIFAEERIFDDNLSKDMTLYKEDTAKSRSPLLNSDLFSFNSQGFILFFFDHKKIFRCFEIGFGD